MYEVCMSYNYELGFNISDLGYQFKKVSTLQNMEYKKAGLPYRVEYIGEAQDEAENEFDCVIITGLEEEITDATDIKKYMELFFNYKYEGENIEELWSFFNEIIDEEVIEIYKMLEGEINQDWFYEKKEECDEKEVFNQLKVLYFDCNFEKYLDSEMVEFYKKNL